MPTAAPSAPPPFAWRHFLGLTAGAGAVFLALRLIPSASDLNHMDFRVDPKAGRAIEFCDPLNPQFIPVVAVPSPVTLAVTPVASPVAGQPVRGVVSLRTGRGKPIGPDDLLVTHTRRLHLLVVDPSLADYQHLHPEPAGQTGDWSFAFTPGRAGTYRVFADFTPAATGRGLYASVDLEVAGAPSGAPAAPPPAAGIPAERAGYRFSLTTRPLPARAGQPLDLRFTVERTDGSEVGLGEVMGAYAHLVAFDAARSGFAHLHPVGGEGARPALAGPRAELEFKLTIPRPGDYMIWAQLSLRGREEFVPFRLTVE